MLSLGWSDFSLKYRGSFLGYFWSFSVPITRFLVIFFVFQPFIGSDIHEYRLYLFLGVILWEYFSVATSACLALPGDKSFIIRNVCFPRILLLLSIGWCHFLIFLTYTLIFLLLAALSGTPLLQGVLYLPVLFLQMMCLTVGIGGGLGAFSLRYKDIQHLWDVLLTILFWMTPIMYPYLVEAPTAHELLFLPSKLFPLSIHSFLAAFVRFQPLSILLYDARRALIYGAAPSLLHIIGFSLFCLMIAILGIGLFRRRSRFFLEEY